MDGQERGRKFTSIQRASTVELSQFSNPQREDRDMGCPFVNSQEPEVQGNVMLRKVSVLKLVVTG